MADPHETARILLVNYEGETDHFAGVEAALAARTGGSGGVRRYTLRDVAEPLPAAVRVVVVKETRSYLSLFALRQARRVGAATVLVMDGIVEYRNTYLNPRAGPDFLRPAPVDVIACAGEVDRRLLESFGNEAVATGLPRLGAAFAVPMAPPTRARSVLVATANQPYFCDQERARLVRALSRLRVALRAAGVSVEWRLTGGLGAELGLPDAAGPMGPLREAMERAAAVITTPSTLMVEAMLAGRPTALLHPHETPCWQPAVWVWRGGEVPEGEIGRGLEPRSLAVADAAELVERLLGAGAAEMGRQRAALAELHQGTRPAAEAVAELIAAEADRLRRAGRVTPLPSVEQLPAEVPPDPRRPRVVACVRLDGTTVGDGLVRAQRLASAAGARGGERGGARFDVHVLAVITQPDSWDPARCTLGGDARMHACVIDPLADSWRTVETVRAGLERLRPAVVLAEADDLCLMAAEHLRAGEGGSGARVVPLVAGDGEGVRSLLEQFGRWDGAMALDASAQSWLRGSAGERPVALVPPIAAAPRAQRPSTVAGRPIRLAYLGPMLEPGHRIHELHGLLAALEDAGVAHELHMVGDGDHLAAWCAESHRRARRWGAITVHGRRGDDWIAAFLPGVDMAVFPGEGVEIGAGVADALACGVVPVLAEAPRPPSAAVRDGVTAIIAPGGELARVAGPIAQLAADRDGLARMSRAASEAAAALPGAAASVDAAEELFERVLNRSASGGPSDLGLRVHHAGRWPRAWCEDEPGAEGWIRERLGAAGFRSIALDRPAPGSDAVILRPAHRRPSLDEIKRWRERGLGIVASPHLRCDPSPLVLRVHGLLSAAMAEGCGRIAIYGTGSHTRRLRDLLGLDVPIVGFLDDGAPAGGGELWGLPVVALQDAATRLAADAVLLSSDAWEARLWERCAPLRDAGVRVIPLYGVYGAGGGEDGVGADRRAGGRRRAHEQQIPSEHTEVTTR